MIINKQLLDSLTAQAKANPRLRQAYDLRTTPADQSQRILNAVEPGTVLPIHRHRGSTETIVVLRGKVVQHYYDDNGNKTASFVLTPYPTETSETSELAVRPVATDRESRRDAKHKPSETLETCACAMSVPVGQWHALESLESGSVIFEAKDGAYEPLSEDDILKI